MKISLFLQLANFIVGHTYLGSPELQFKPKFDPVAQMVEELDRNIRARAARAGKIQLSVNDTFSLQWIIFLISYTYFGSRVVHFKTKFDRLAQMVQELARDIRAAHGDTLFLPRPG